MSQSALETFKTKAVNSVLFTLGEPLFSVLKDHLQRDYKILLYENAFTLEELQIALQRILGANPSDLIIREIRFQIEELEKEQLP